MRLFFCDVQRDRNQSDRGFTLIEVLVVVIMIGILSAISAPSFLGFLNRQRMNTAQGTLYNAFRDAQSLAKTEKLVPLIGNSQVAFRTLGTTAQFVVSRRLPGTATAADWNSLPWQNLESGIRYDIPYMTFTPPIVVVPNPPVYRVAFDNNGNVVGGISGLGRVTITNQSGVTKSCIIVSTLLGATRTAKDTDCN